MLGDIDGRRGRVRVEVRLTTPDCPFATELRHAVTTCCALLRQHDARGLRNHGEAAPAQLGEQRRFPAPHRARNDDALQGRSTPPIESRTGWTLARASHTHPALAVPVQASVDSAVIAEARRSRIIACPPRRWRASR